MKWRIVNHNSISREDLLMISKLKDQHWSFGIDSQVDWIKKNIKDGDVHLIGEETVSERGIAIRAYATLTHLQVSIDNENHTGIGIGSVCVDKELLHQGLGKELILEANKYINNCKCLGVLLCKDYLVAFYKKCNWNLLKYNVAEVGGIDFKQNIMVLDNVDFCRSIIINRNF